MHLYSPMKPLLFIVLSLLITFPGYSQKVFQLKGKVTNTAGDHISHATVSILNTGKSAVCDGNGFYRIAAIPEGKYLVSVSATGYAAVVVETSLINDPDSFNFILAPSYSTLDEVVVSVDKTDEKLQQVPAAISSLGSRQVKEFRLWNINGITGIVPNLYSAHSGDNRNVTTIRGIGTTSYEQAVATYVDGVNQFSLDTYIPNLFDIERIEVLRGPQGTLYGRNAMGGVINIITRKPSNHAEGNAEINLGNYGLQRIGLSFKLPLVRDKLFFGAAGLYEQRNGYYTNKFTGTDFDRQKYFNGNYYLKYLPSPKTDVTLNFKHLNNKNNGPFPLVTGKDAAFAEPFTVNQNAVTTMQDDNLNASLSFNYFSRTWMFTSQTAYQSNYRIYQKPIDGDFSPLDAISIINDYGKDYNKVKVWTEEFRFSSRNNDTRKWNWTLGSFFFAQDNPVKQGISFGKDAGILGIPDSNFTLINTNLSRNKGMAFFGQATYRLSPKWDFTVGTRWDMENRRLTVSGEYFKEPGPLFTVLGDTSASGHFSAFSPKAGINYHLKEGQLFYLNYSRGYRSGGFTSLTSDPSQPPLFAYEPEFSNNFELGWKTQFWKNKMTVNAAIFYSFVNHVQVPTLLLPDAITIIRNSGHLTSKGIEVEMMATLLKGLEVIYSGGITDARYGLLNLAVNGNMENLVGNRQIFTPSFTSMLTGQYSYVPANHPKLRLLARLEWFYLGDQYFDLPNTIHQQSYGIINGRLGGVYNHAGLFLWARNLGNTKYISYAYDFGGVHLGDPLTFGATVTMTL